MKFKKYIRVIAIFKLEQCIIYTLFVMNLWIRLHIIAYKGMGYKESDMRVD